MLQAPHNVLGVSFPGETNVQAKQNMIIKESEKRGSNSRVRWGFRNGSAEMRKTEMIFEAVREHFHSFISSLWPCPQGLPSSERGICPQIKESQG